MRILRILRGGYAQQLKTAVRVTGLVGLALSAIPQAVVFGWLLRPRVDFQNYDYLVDSSGAGVTTTTFATPEQVIQLTVGSFLLAMWTVQVVKFGFSLSQELSQGTYELTLVAGARIPLVLLAKSLAYLTIGAAAGLLAFATVAVTAWQLPEVHDPGALALGVAATVVAVLATSFVFAPFIVVAAGKSGFFSALVPLGVVLGGFLYPVDLLPLPLEAVARLVPTSWSVSAIVGAATGEAASSEIGRDCLVALALSFGWAFVTVHLLSRVERRVRLVGSLAG
jgi:ABC-2 type transport system permease protein